jgi:hypothetical protein
MDDNIIFHNRYVVKHIFFGATGLSRSMLRDDADVGKDNGCIRRDVKKGKIK